MEYSLQTFDNKDVKNIFKVKLNVQILGIQTFWAFLYQS